jgi:hypothetical protein
VREVTQADVIQSGGWYWFVGKISGLPVQKGVFYVPPPVDNLIKPVLPVWGEWVEFSDIEGRWWGPLTPPDDVAFRLLQWRSD